LNRFALGVGAETIEIFDMPKTVATEGELVCCDAETNVTNIKGLLAVVRGTGI
jgi:hypothetical protein